MRIVRVSWRITGERTVASVVSERLAKTPLKTRASFNVEIAPLDLSSARECSRRQKAMRVVFMCARSGRQSSP